MAAGSEPLGTPPAKAVLRRARAILRSFDASSSVLGISELARRSGLPKATVHRLVQELVECELLERDGHRYRLGTWLYELGQRAPAHRSLRVVAAPFLDDLAHVTQETVLLVVPGRSGMLFTEKYVGSRGRGRVVTQLDGRVPPHSAASGKAILAFGPPERVDELCATTGPETQPPLDEPRLRAELAEIRRRGYAVSHIEPAPGYGAIAAPVWSDATVVAALSIVAPGDRLDIGRFSAALQLACTALTRRLRGAHAQAFR
ncbi:IclR family transcriptional regulator [Amycolatopsis carbonis]|uniref:IclR family transcriptional regulator n=1 Tax=Amycolatopsis carbonis TaxID=715471 RepID=A0A9Y2I9X9_9PSEU|nr:IclR family transcriptional regulator [Amycolatopsis sp. 2-15]WIX76520.1 IclR family transcriptional regulator [Amycolatopsis sp. 2-15]